MRDTLGWDWLTGRYSALGTNQQTIHIRTSLPTLSLQNVLVRIDNLSMVLLHAEQLAFSRSTTETLRENEISPNPFLKRTERWGRAYLTEDWTWNACQHAKWIICCQTWSYTFANAAGNLPTSFWEPLVIVEGGKTKQNQNSLGWSSSVRSSEPKRLENLIQKILRQILVQVSLCKIDTVQGSWTFSKQISDYHRFMEMRENISHSPCTLY